MTFLVIGVLVVAVLVLLWALCAMAKIGDRNLEEARRSLAEEYAKRDRLGL